LVFWVQSAAMTPVDAIRYEAVAEPQDARERLDRFLARACDGLSRMRIKALIADGQALVGGRTVTDPSYRVKPGERVVLTVPPAVEAAPQAQAMPLQVVYEDAALIVVDKPAGLVVHPAPGNPDRTLVNALLAHCGESLSGIGGVRRPGIVHRLDKDTSGLLVAAKSAPAHAALVAQFQARRIERRYQAVVWGVPRPARDRIEAAIGRDPLNRKKMAVVSRGGKPAVTDYVVERAFAGTAALLACRLQTGRTHQIRVHLADRGHPVVGDPLYGRARGGRRRQLPAAVGAAVTALHGQALHAGVLAFEHPINGSSLRFESSLPEDIAALLEALQAAADMPK